MTDDNVRSGANEHDLALQYSQAVTEMESWSSVALGRLIGTLRVSYEAGQATARSIVALDAACDVLGERKTRVECVA